MKTNSTTYKITDMGLSYALAQALLAFFMGVFLSAVYLRTGNIWPLILIHSLHDILTSSAIEKMTAHGADFPDWITALLCVIEGILLVSGFYLLRKSKRAEIIELWNRRWSRI